MNGIKRHNDQKTTGHSVSPPRKPVKVSSKHTLTLYSRPNTGKIEEKNNIHLIFDLVL